MTFLNVLNFGDQGEFVHSYTRIIIHKQNSQIIRIFYLQGFMI